MANTTGQETIRLLPVSGGVFAADFKPDMHHMTFSALALGFESLPDETQKTLMGKELKMCIFLDTEVPMFTRAHDWACAGPDGDSKL